MSTDCNCGYGKGGIYRHMPECPAMIDSSRQMPAHAATTPTQGVSGLVERLLRAGNSIAAGSFGELCGEAADALQAASEQEARSVEALRKIEAWCCPVLCANCRDNKKTASQALGREG